LSKAGKLFRALVNPCANQTDLIVGKLFRTFALGHESVRVVAGVSKNL
jgi:hypothetical protein